MEALSISANIFLWAFGLTFTGIFLSIGFAVGKWVVEKVRGWFKVRRGMKEDIVKEFLAQYGEMGK